MRLAACAMILAGLMSPAVAQTQPPLRPGEPPRELRIAGGETQTFEVALTARDFLRVRVDQKDIDLVLRIRGPEGTTPVEATNTIAYDVEFISTVAPVAGTYRIEVQPTAADAPSGAYQIALLAAGTASAVDEKHAQADALFTAAGSLRRQGSASALREALATYASARDLYVEASDALRTAESWNRIGVVDLSLNDYRPALKAFETALPMLVALGDRRFQGVMLNNIGLTQWNLAEAPLALDYYQKSLAIRREVSDQSGEASTLFNMALVRNTLGDSRGAIALHEQALPLRRAIRDRAGEARTLTSLAVAQRDVGELQKAFDNFGRARPIVQALGDKFGEVNVVRGLARAYLTLGDLERAQASIDEALTLVRALANRRVLSLVQTSAADIARARGDQKGALSLLEEALAVFRALPDRPSEVGTLIRIGQAHLALGADKEALSRADEAMTIARDLKDLNGIAGSFGLHGDAALKAGRPDEALRAFGEELAIWSGAHDRVNEAGARFGVARAQADLGDVPAALDSVTSAIALLEAMRTTILNPDLRATYRARSQKYFELQIDLQMRLHEAEPTKGHDVEALISSERSRARGLIESLGGNLALIQQDADPKLATLRDEQLGTLSALEYRRTVATSATPGAVAAPSDEEINAALGSYRDTEGRLLASSPRYAAVLAPPDVNANALRRAVGEDAVLVEFALGETRSFAWTVSADGISSFVLPGRAVVEEKARRLYEALTARNRPVADASVAARRARLAAADRTASNAAAELGLVVLSPTAAKLRAKRIVFVPDGALHLVPFGVVPAVKGGPPLSAAHEVTLLPSATLLSDLRRPRAKATGVTVAVLADPVFELADPRVKAVVRSSAAASRSAELVEAAKGVGLTGFSRLEFSREEAKAIASLVPKAAGYEALDFSATRDGVLSPEVAHARIVHFATHGVMNTNQPALSGLVLSLIDEEGAARDGYFRLHDIYNLKLDAELVVLSACRTGVGRELKGEGVMALTRGFLAAGAPRVVATLWDVDDRATAELMSRFYRAMLVGGERPSAALSTAQRSLARIPRWSAPYYWAGFTLVGDWR